MKLFKAGTVIAILLAWVTLLRTMIFGCFFTEDTLVWIEIKGYELISYDWVGVFMLIAPILTAVILWMKLPRKIKMFALLFPLALGGWAYTQTLTSAWQEVFQIAEDMILYPDCMLYPMALDIVTLLALFAIWAEDGKEKHDEFDGTTECAGSGL